MPLPVLSVARSVAERTYEASAVDIDKYAARVIDYAESQKERARRAEVQLRLDIYRDAWGAALQTLLKSTVHPQVYARVGKYGDLSRNPAKRIWSELAVLYTAEPRRWTEPPEAGERYKAIQKKATLTPFAMFWQDVEELVQVCNEVLIWPEVVTLPGGDKIPQNRYCCGNAFSIVWSTDVRGLMECVIELEDREDPAGNEERIYHIWTDDWYAAYRRDDATEVVTRVDNPDQGPANPYGKLPHWLIRRRTWQDIDLDEKSGTDIVKGTLVGACAQQVWRYHQKMSGFKQAAVTGEDVDELPQQLLDPGQVLKVTGHDIALEIIDWQLKLQEQQDVMDTDELRLAASRGINPERYKRTANYQTTFGAAMSERPLEYLRSRMVPPFSIAEEAYYRACCMVWEAHGLADAPSADAEFSIEHVPLKAPEDPESQLDTEAKELALMLVDEIGLLKRRRPDLSDEEARAEIKRIAENRAEIQKLKVTHNLPNNPMNQSASAEQNGRTGPAVRDGDNGNEGNPPGSRPGQAPDGE